MPDPLRARRGGRLVMPFPAAMPFVDPDMPNRFSHLALYASLVATGVIVLNVAMVRLARKLGLFQSRFRERLERRERGPRE